MKQRYFHTERIVDILSIEKPINELHKSTFPCNFYATMLAKKTSHWNPGQFRNIFISQLIYSNNKPVKAEAIISQINATFQDTKLIFILKITSDEY